MLVACSTMLGASEWDGVGAALVDGINSNEGAARIRAVRAVFSETTRSERGDDALVDLLARLHGDFAPLEYHHAEVAAFDRPDGVRRVLHVFARREGANRWHDFQLRLDPRPPHLVSSLGFIAEVSEPVRLPNGGLQNRETLDWLDRYIAKLERENDLSGAMLIARGDQIVVQSFFGHADVASQRPVDEKTRFDMASGGKMFTALGILRLMERGDLDLDDPLSKYLDEPAVAGLEQVRIRHLLSHTSGLPEYWTPETDEAFHAAENAARHTDLALRIVARDGLQSQPGSTFAYSNTNFALLGAVLAVVHEGPYEQAVRALVLEPAGLENTTFGRTEEAAEPMTRDDGGPWRAVSFGRGRGSAAGGAFTTPRDALRFSRALVSERIVSRETLADMTRPHSPSGSQLTYGLGFVLERSADGVPSFGHGGIASGVNFEFRYFPTSDTTLALFSNQDNGAYDDLERNTIRLITGER